MSDVLSNASVADKTEPPVPLEAFLAADAFAVVASAQSQLNVDVGMSLPVTGIAWRPLLLPWLLPVGLIAVWQFER